MQDFRRPLTLALIGALIVAGLGCGYTLAIRNITSSMGAVGSLPDVRLVLLSKGLQFGALGAFFGLLYAVTSTAPATSPTADAAEGAMSKDKLDRLVQKQMRDAYGDAAPPTAPTAVPPKNVDR